MTRNSRFALSVNMIWGRADDEDKDRAAAAAVAVLDAAGVSIADAFAEFKRQWSALDSCDGMTGLAALWVEAEEAADRALTQGWANPDGASCGISA
jgi:hypothetical protein